MTDPPPPLPPPAKPKPDKRASDSSLLTKLRDVKLDKRGSDPGILEKLKGIKADKTEDPGFMDRIKRVLPLAESTIANTFLVRIHSNQVTLTLVTRLIT